MLAALSQDAALAQVAQEVEKQTIQMVMRRDESSPTLRNGAKARSPQKPICNVRGVNAT